MENTHPEQIIENLLKNLDTVLGDMLHPSLKDIAQIYLRSINEIIAADIKNGLSYIGGFLEAELKSGEQFTVAGVIYYKNSNDRVIKKSTGIAVYSIARLKQEDAMLLSRHKLVKWEIPGPEVS